MDVESNRKQVGAIDRALLARVDVARGDVPRAKFVERALRVALGELSVGPMSDASVAAKQSAHDDGLGAHEPAVTRPPAAPRASGPLLGCQEALCLKKGAKGDLCPVHALPFSVRLAR